MRSVVPSDLRSARSLPNKSVNKTTIFIYLCFTLVMTEGPLHVYNLLDFVVYEPMQDHCTHYSHRESYKYFFRLGTSLSDSIIKGNYLDK